MTDGVPPGVTAGVAPDPADEVVPPADTVPPSGTTPQPAGRSRSRGCAFEVIETVVLTLVIFFVVQTFLAQPFRVDGASMQSSFENDEYVLVDKLTPRFTGYHRGDVVVLDPPVEQRLDSREPFIKRVIGVAGDTVELRDGQVVINGIAIREPYTYNGEATDPESDDTRWVVGPGQVFVLGDHRRRSQDSRVFGPIEQSSLVGRAWLRYWPLDSLSIVTGPTYPELGP